MNIAIIGAGISGLTAAHYLHEAHAVTVFEANPYAGGHTDTHHVQLEGRTVAVDTGFIVFNERNYPNFTALLRELGIRWQSSDMSFSVVNEQSGVTYGAATLGRLFAQRRNLIRLPFYKMLWDILRFYREAPALLETQDDTLTLGDYLRRNGYGDTFIQDHILPMASALWSAPAELVEQFPARYFVAFMHNHRMLQVNDRPQWCTLIGGSNQYVQAISARLGNRLRLGTPVLGVRREPGRVVIRTAARGEESFDAVVFACHSDQALRLLQDPSSAEQGVLGAIPYQRNIATLHSDVRLLPPERAAWSSWNARIPRHSNGQCNVSYWMNLLQNIQCRTPLIVTLNAEDQIDRSKVWAEREYHHPVYTRESLAAQQRRSEINGVNRSWFCGAYWGWGFHEDGVRSALDVVSALQDQRQEVAA